MKIRSIRESLLSPNIFTRGTSQRSQLSTHLLPPLHNQTFLSTFHQNQTTKIKSSKTNHQNQNHQNQNHQNHITKAAFSQWSCHLCPSSKFFLRSSGSQHSRPTAICKSGTMTRSLPSIHSYTTWRQLCGRHA